MSKEAMKLALEALEKLWNIIDDIDTYGDMAKGDEKLYRALVERRQRTRFEETGISTDGYELTGGGITAIKEALREHAMREVQRLGQEIEQEPVAVVSGYYGGQCVILPIDPARILNSNTALYTTPQPCPTCEALARTVMLDQTSHDAQRTWVGLTDEAIWLEYQKFWPFHPAEEPTLAKDIAKFARAIEAKLKEKNT